jgi:uncharacterized protein (TIGR00251 family)
MTFPEFIADKDLPLHLAVRVSPGAKQTAITGMMSDGITWKLRVVAPPEKGKANAEICRLFAARYGLAAEIVAGHTGRQKVVRLSRP